MPSWRRHRHPSRVTFACGSSPAAARSRDGEPIVACTTTSSRPTTPLTPSVTRMPRASYASGVYPARRWPAVRVHLVTDRSEGSDARTLWQGRFSEPPSDALMAFTASLAFDRRLAADDIAGSRAHVAMLGKVGLLTSDEVAAVLGALETVEHELTEGSFAFAASDEDIHTAIERRVTELAGDAGAKLHTGRSRNDQVATDLRLYVRREGRIV